MQAAREGSLGSPDTPSPLELQIGEAARGKPATVTEVITKLGTIFELAKTSPQGEADGIACFTSLYNAHINSISRLPWSAPVRGSASISARATSGKTT